ncbi:MAG: tail fiber protein [Acidobacteriota bacterium]
MIDATIGEIRLFAFGFAPRGWLPCDGQILPINQNESLHAVLGTRYGGDGRTTFRLPDLRGRVPIGNSEAYPVGKSVGAEAVRLTDEQVPAHRHLVRASSRPGTETKPDGHVLAAGEPDKLTPYREPPSEFGKKGHLGLGLKKAGGGEPHPNVAPFLVLGYYIAIVGDYPARD